MSDHTKATYVIGDLDSAKMLTRRAAASTVIGTPAFMAPEVLTSEGEIIYDFSADGTYAFHSHSLRGG